MILKSFYRPHFFFFFYKIQKMQSKRKRAMATQSNWKDSSQLLIKMEFWTTALVINQCQANLKQRKIKVCRREPGPGFRQPVNRSHKTRCRKWCCTFITAAPTWPPGAASEEADHPHTLSSCISAATKYAHIISQRTKLYQKHQCEKGKIFNSWWVTCVI